MGDQKMGLPSASSNRFTAAMATAYTICWWNWGLPSDGARPSCAITWGNHDASWMGACLGHDAGVGAIIDNREVIL